GFGKAGSARRAGTLYREVLLLQFAVQHFVQAVDRPYGAHDALSVLQRRPDGLAQPGFVVGVHYQVGHRQFDGVFLVAVQARPGAYRYKRPVYPQMGVALGARPFGKVGVITLARGDQGRQQADMLALVLAQQARHDLVGVLRFHRHIAIGAVLRAQLHIQQPQEMVDLGHRGHRRLAPAAAGALLDGNRGRNAEDRVHVRLAGRLDDGARVGVERFQVAPLPFVEQDVEGQGRLARARHAGDHGELVVRDLDADVFQVVLARVADLDG